MTPKIIIPEGFSLCGIFIEGWIDCLVKDNLIYPIQEKCFLKGKHAPKDYDKYYFIGCASQPVIGSEVVYKDVVIDDTKFVFGERIAPKKPGILENIIVHCLYGNDTSNKDLYDWGLRLKVYINPNDITAVCTEPFFFVDKKKKVIESHEIFATQFYVPRYSGLYIDDGKLKYEAPPKISTKEIIKKKYNPKDFIITME